MIMSSRGAPADGFRKDEQPLPAPFVRVIMSKSWVTPTAEMTVTRWLQQVRIPPVAVGKESSAETVARPFTGTSRRPVMAAGARIWHVGTPAPRGPGLRLL